ncbi:YqgE/AlgH family protein [Corynebacterium callunae]|uniref:YqgE/AlgH family protein n=1 Tax=Corynebacterium callunae TaxID=1721 RepID=UPI0039828A53
MSDFYADRLFNALERNEVSPGMLLVSAPDMASEDFERSVILVIEHSPVTTFGVNIASRSDVAVANVLPEWVDLTSKPQALYIGGPLSQQAVVGLGVTKPGVDIEASTNFNKLANRLVHVDLRTEPEAVAPDLEGMRFFAGYAEWAPGQLNEEIEQGDWFVAPALPSDIIAPGRVDVWGDVMRRQAMPLPLYATYPSDPSDN